MAKNSRGKGLDFVREVKSILQSLGHQTEGPGYITLTIPKEIDFNGIKKKIFIPIQSHKDYFGCFDLISWDPNIKKFCFHQVSTDHNKSTKIKAIVAKGMAGNVWTRCKDGYRVMYRTYFVSQDGKVTEGEFYYLPKKEKKEGTRAFNRAVSNLVGFGEVSAEEVEDTGHKQTTKQPDKPPEGMKDKVISEAQAKRFYAIAKKAGWDDKSLKGYMMQFWGIDSTKRIPKWNYEEYCEIIGKGMPKDTEGCTKDPTTCEVSIWGQDGKADCAGKPCMYQAPVEKTEKLEF